MLLDYVSGVLGECLDGYMQLDSLLGRQIGSLRPSPSLGQLEEKEELRSAGCSWTMCLTY